MMLIARGLPSFLWAEAAKYASYIRNCVATRALTDRTLHEAWTGRKPNVAHFHEFGCDVWILDTGDRSKLDPKANKFIFVGFEDGPRAICYYSSATRRICISCDFTFETHTESDVNYIEFGIGEPAESVEQSAKPVARDRKSVV